MTNVWRVELHNGEYATQFTEAPMTAAEFEALLHALFMGYRVRRFRDQRGGPWHDVERLEDEQ